MSGFSGFKRLLFVLIAAAVPTLVLAACAIQLRGDSSGPTPGRRAEGELQKDVATHHAKLEAYETLCRRLGEEPAHVALAWLLHQKAVTAPIIGPRTQAQLDGSLRALDITLAPETLATLDDVFPGPGGPAPEAYAW